MKLCEGAVLAVILLAGCAPITAVGGKLTLPDQGFEVDLPPGWYRIEAASVREALLLTKDGLPLQFIRIERVAVEKALSHTTKRFTQGMPPQEAAAVEVDNLRSGPEMADFTLLENEPANVGGRRGFRLVATWKTKEGLRLKRIHYGFLDGPWVYRLIYQQAAARHYFDRDLATFDVVRASLRLL